MERLIPAGAGKTCFFHSFSFPCTAHPRRCGENVKRKPRYLRRGGSSPQVRGKPQFRQICSYRPRLIPAGAGKTVAKSNSVVEVTAHPRRCGENFGGLNFLLRHAGSSPQVRGKRSSRCCCVRLSRLIPAGAGKTANAQVDLERYPAHPRRCGENDDGVYLLLGETGSSPQVRGKLP